ncbi:MAG: hypothetical protein M9892_03265 [Bacteroidetes bacterium]|nr:hypothetical protein [Bacteroidota bacterium]
MSKHKEVFEANPNVNQIYVTTDGVPFLDGHRAKLHQRSTHPEGRVEVVHKVEATSLAESVEATSEVKKTAEARIADINAATTVEEVDILLNGEKAKTVIAAGEAKIEEINKKDKEDKK